MATKVKGEAIKEYSIPLNALMLGDKLIELFEPSGSVLNIFENNVYYNFPFPLPPTQNVLYCIVHESIIELKKGINVELQNGPAAYLTWDDNGVKISNDAEYYNVECYNNIAIKSNITSVDPVVWKYLCNPYILKNNETIPTELLDDHGNFKYINRGMYLIHVTSNNIDDKEWNMEGEINMYIPVNFIESDGYTLYGAFTFISTEGITVTASVMVHIVDGKASITSYEN